MIIEYVLLLVFYAGGLSHSDSSSMVAVAFASKEECVAAGKEAETMQTMVKTVKYVCVKRSRAK